MDNYTPPINLPHVLQYTNNDQNIEKYISPIYQTIYNETKFNQVSVVVIDYEMPGINGIELCKLIKDTTIKKIILTSRATERIAIDAFNNQTIDAFIFKEEIEKSLIPTIQKLQYNYFADISSHIRSLCPFTKEPFLKNLINIEINIARAM